MPHIEIELDFDPVGHRYYHVWCEDCKDNSDLDTEDQAWDWRTYHECEEWAGDEPNMSGDDGPTSAGYRQTLRDAGRGHLL